MISVQEVFHKIRQICQNCYESSQQLTKIPRNYKNVSSLTSADKYKEVPQFILKQYLGALQTLEQYLYELKQCKNQYQNLQQYLQKQETQIRKHIGIEQQLRLYTDGIKIQLEQCQKQRVELLQNSKKTIKDLKMKNQKLYEEITELRKSFLFKDKINQKHYQNSRIKTKIKDKSASASAQRKDSSLKKIIKTQYIERQKHPHFVNVNIKRELKYKNQKIDDMQKKHRHHKSTYEQQKNSESKKKHRMDLLQKCKKQKFRTCNSKNFDLGTYLNKHEHKISPFKKQRQSKNQRAKKGQKHVKSVMQQRKQQQSRNVLQTEDKKKKQRISSSQKRQRQQKGLHSKSKQKSQQIKRKQNINIKKLKGQKDKVKQQQVQAGKQSKQVKQIAKKTYHHNSQNSSNNNRIKSKQLTANNNTRQGVNKRPNRSLFEVQGRLDINKRQIGNFMSALRQFKYKQAWKRIKTMWQGNWLNIIQYNATQQPIQRDGLCHGNKYDYNFTTMQ